MTNGPNSRKRPAEIEHEAADERHRERGRAIGADPHHRVAGERGDDIFAEQARAAGEAAIRLLRHLEIVVVEADHGEAGGDEQHDPHIGAFEIGPQQRRDEEAEQDHEPAHGRRALLGEKMRGRSVGADRLPLALFQPQRGDDRRTEEEDEEKPGSRGAERAEGEIAEEVEGAWELGEPGQHVLASRADERSDRATPRRAAPSGCRSSP